MEVFVQGLKTVYDVVGEGAPLVLLHGWGVERSVFSHLQEHFSCHMQVWSLDFPGFGESNDPPKAWGVNDYADFTKDFCRIMRLDNPSILGHSFGGRVAIVLAAQGFGVKLVLTDAAGLKPKRNAVYYIRVYSYKAAKKVMSLPGLKRWYEAVLNLWLRRNPSGDYVKALGIMRSVFVKVVNEDLGPLLPRINIPTLLMWGENDNDTPLTDGKKMEKLIPDSGLVVFKGAGHYPFLEQPEYFYRVLKSFFGIRC
ncbi:MAG: alpha/beta hydrolase [Clostridiales bacterium]|nr:alpha/beta hydrolase [Clostridiales bacterium]